ncbi:MAG: PAS domain S-box protein, partial [Deltaproteobacteria bacterium]|nr:PAS domain S-box protein [Deltaproteobacteria bacterium]
MSTTDSIVTVSPESIVRAFDILEEGAFIINAQGAFLKINIGFTALLGYDKGDITKISFSDIKHTPADEQDTVKRRIVRTFEFYYLERCEKKSMQMQLVHKDGSFVSLMLRASINRDEQGKMKSAIGIIRPLHAGRTASDCNDSDPEASRVWELEQNYLNLLDNSGDAIFITDFSGRLQTVNRAALRLLERKDEKELAGSFLLEIGPIEGTYACTTGETVTFDETYQQQQIDTSDQLFEHGRAVGIIYLFKNDQLVVPVEATLTILKDLNGEQRGTIALCRDITDRMKYEMEVTRSRDFLDSIIATTGDGVYATDAAGYIVRVNQAFCDITGYSEPELVGMYAPNLQPDDPYTTQDEYELMHAEDYFERFEALWKRKGGTLYPVEAKIRNLKDKAGMISGIVGSIRDITERKQAEAALRKAHDELEHKVRERTHDLKEANTALRVLLKGRDDDRTALEEKMFFNVNELVLPHIEKIKNTRLDERQKTYLGIVESNLNDIVSPFVTIFSNQQLKLTPTEIQVANLVKLGKTTKEIAEIANLSPRTIECHRESIRKKIGIKNRKVNLRTYLLTKP